MIRLLMLLLALSLIASPLAGGHAVEADGAGGEIHEMGISLLGEPQQDAQCLGDHAQSERNCCEVMMSCNVDLAFRTANSVRADNFVSIVQYVSNSDYRDSIESLVDTPPPRT